MIAQRFRPVGWVAGVAVAACALYMISLQVASKRGKLEEIDRKIAETRREIRQLQTEMGTRASLRQLERWNGEVLALTAPAAGQYLPGEAALAAVSRDRLGPESAAPPPVMMAVMTAEPDAPPEAAPILAAIAKPQPQRPMTPVDRVVQRAIAPARATVAERPVDRKPVKLAKVDGGLLDRGTIGELTQRAGRERKRDVSQP